MSEIDKIDADFPETIEFISGAIKFKHVDAEYTIKRPSALQSVSFQKEIGAIDKEDLEIMVKFYIKVVTAQGLPSSVAQELDLFSLGDVFRAINSPAAKKK